MARRALTPLLDTGTLSRLLAELHRSPIGPGNRLLQPTPARAVQDAVAAFAELGGRSHLAAKQCEPTMIELGRRAARRGLSPSDVQHTFDIVSSRCLHRIDDFVEPVQPTVSMRSLQPRLRSYLPQLLQFVIVGHQQVSELLALSPERRRAELLGALFRAVAVPGTLLEVADIDTTTPYAPVGWVDQHVPLALLQELDALTTDDTTLALVPAASLSALTDLAPAPPESRVVVGPVHRTPDIAASLALTRQATAAVRADVIRNLAAVISCTDIAEQLLVSGSPALTAVLIDKHLARFARLRPERRVMLGRALLDWMENHYTYADLAAHLHVPRQTAHDQVKAAKTLVGPAADDPQACAGIIIALRAALPQWERDV